MLLTFWNLHFGRPQIHKVIDWRTRRLRFWRGYLSLSQTILRCAALHFWKRRKRHCMWLSAYYLPITYFDNFACLGPGTGSLPASLELLPQHTPAS